MMIQEISEGKHKTCKFTRLQYLRMMNLFPSLVVVFIMEEGKPQPQHTYFQLIDKVGSRGRYQHIVIAIFCLITLLTGAMSLGSPYYFAVAPYVNCPP
jgi:hypothetical protein